MRTILHVIESRGPGGAETVLRDLVERTTRDGQRALAVIPEEPGWLARELPDAAQRKVQPTPPSRSGPLDVKYIRGLRRVIVTERPALIHAHSFDTALYSSLASLGTAIPMLATFHGASDVKRYGLRSRLKWAAVSRAGALICVSQSLARLARSTPGLPAARVRAILNGSNLTPFSGTTSDVLRSQLGLAPGTTLIGALGNLRPPKGYPVLLDAIALLRARGLDVHLAIAGDDRGPLGNELRAHRARLGLDAHVSLVGFVDTPALFLEGLDLFVLSSHSEGFSLSTVQAMAAARAIVATRSGGPEELLVEGESGLLVPTKNPGALAGALERLACDAPLGARMGGAARERALALFSLEEMVRKYESLYDELVVQ